MDPAVVYPFTESLQLRFENCLIAAFRSAPLPNLKSLQLEYFAAESLHLLLMASPGIRSPGRFMSRFQHLSLSFANRVSGFNHGLIIDPISRDEGKYSLFFFRLATNLRSLTINSTRYFDLDDLGQNLQNLDSLKLCHADVKYHPCTLFSKHHFVISSSRMSD